MKLSKPALALAAMAALAPCAAAAPEVANCGLTVGSATIDLSALSSAGPYTKTVSPYTYKFQVCGTVPASTGNGCTDTSPDAQMYQFLGSKCETYESKWEPETIQWKLIDASNPKGGVMYTVDNGPECNVDGSTEPRVVNYKFVCDEGGQDFGDFSVPVNAANGSSCETTFQLTTRLACPGSSAGPDDDDDDDDGGSHKSSGGGGLSGGWVFNIILIVCAVLYCAVGAALNHRKGATGAELCPNLEFWRSMPGLVKDGCSFTVEKIRGCMGGSGGGGADYNGM